MPAPHNVLVFGGSFNPPTIAHEAIVAACLALTQFDQIWLMPSGERLDKHMGASDQQRLQMAHILKNKRFAGDARVCVSDFELELPRPTQTYRTANALQTAYPKVVFWWAFGTDSFYAMPRWQQGTQLQRTLNILLFKRGQDDMVIQPNVMSMQLPSGLTDVSSTAVRQALDKAEDIDQAVSQPILRYIEQHKLYRNR